MSPKQALLLTHLLASPSLAVAAGRADIPEGTAYRLAADPAFQDAYKTAQREALAASTARAAVLTGAGIAALQAMLTDDTVPAAVRLGVVKTIFEIAEKGVADVNLAERIAVLEGERATHGAA